jgi:hypothetical protein
MDKESVFDKGATQSGSTTKTHWTIMVYIVADGTLANFAVESLKQLIEFASKAGDDLLKVVVGAQFAFHTGVTAPAFPSKKASGGATNPHLLLKRGSGGVPDANDTIRNVLALADKSERANASQEEMLKRFLNSVHTDTECKANRYALILWGHGPELLFQARESNTTGSSNRLYIAPEELRGALRDWKDLNGRELDIIGFDACFMSMFEMAYELKGLATYMVASQEEVPDASFPYDKLVELFRTNGNNTELLLKEGVKAYLDTYREYIFGESTGLNPVTLSVFQLDNREDLGVAVKSLASALLAAPDDEGFRNLLIEARQKSRDYAGGLYVDLYEFCSNLSTQLGKPDATDKWKSNIQTACGGVLKALELSADGTSGGLILKNGSDDPRSHGISIYLPYLTKEQFAKVNRPLVKGTSTSHSGKGFDDVINGAASEYLMCARRDLILDTESYYGCLQLALDTDWYLFITDLWTKVLIKTAPADLDFHYSAQQSWMNVCRKCI